MPLALEPNQRFPIVLDSDLDKPADARPTFYVRSLSMREQVALADDMDAALDYTKEVSQITADVCELLKRYLVGWQSMGTFVFSDMDLTGLLSNGEACEILRKIMRNSYVQPDEKKS